jgi:cytochrome c-type biogenesis protein CcmE
MMDKDKTNRGTVRAKLSKTQQVSIFDLEKSKNIVILVTFCDSQKESVPTGQSDRLCGLVVRGSAYRSIGSGSIPGATRFSE